MTGSLQREDVYWPTLEGADLAEAAYRRVEHYYNGLLSNSIMYQRWVNAYRVFYGLSGLDDPFDISRAGIAGDRDQLTSVKINHAGTLARQKTALISQTIPDLDATPSNDDERSIEATEFAKKLLAYFMDHRMLAAKFLEQADIAEIFNIAWLRIEWDARAGSNLQQPDPNNSARTKTGDVTFKVFAPLDVVMDRFRYDDDHQWQITRDFVSRWDLVARYATPPPGADEETVERLTALRQDILNVAVPKWPGSLPSSNRIETERMNSRDFDIEQVPMYCLYHRPSDAIPAGRVAFFLNADILLYAGPNPYGKIPLIPMSPGRMWRTPYGDSDFHHVLGQQEVYDNVSSSVATNNVALATALIGIPEECNYSYQELAEGLAAITFRAGPEGKLKPEAINLNPDNGSALKFLEHSRGEMESIMSIPAALRGRLQPDMSGSLGALVIQQAMTNAGSFQQSFHTAVALAGQLLLKILQTFSDQPQIAIIAGKRRAFEIASFSSKDLAGVETVTVKSGNPAARTALFADQMADNLLNMGLLTGPEGVRQYAELVRTGDIDILTAGPEGQELLIRREDEMLMRGQQPIVAVTDQHKEHIESHADVLNSPEARANPAIVKAVTDHNTAHIMQLRTADPALLMLLGQTPLPPLPQPGVIASPPPNQQPAPPGHPGVQAGPNPAPPPPHPIGQPPRMPVLPQNPSTGHQMSPHDGAVRTP
ncbi:MAG: hypothetical protein ACYC9X_00665 [Dehalococcoidia bacterium]